MVNESTTHWTDDDELVSRFVLRRLSPPEEKQLSSHLATCEKCRRAVNKEARFVAGVKQVGRAEMKGRVRSRLELIEHESAVPGPSKMSRDRMPWTTIAGVAAAIAIIVSVGVYNDWFGSGHRTSSSTMKQLTREEPMTVPDTSRRQPYSQPVGQESEQGNGAAEASQFTENDNSKQLASGTAEHKKEKVRIKQDFAREDQANPMGSIVKVKPEAAASIPQKEDNVVSIDQAINPLARTFWVTGHLLPQSSARDYAITQPETNRTKKTAQRDFTSQVQDVRFPIFLKQKPLSALPSTIQTSDDQPGTIHTLIENGEHEIQMTFFFDSPLLDSELKAPDIKIAHNDSLIVSFSNQHIGLTLPPALIDKVNLKAKEVK